MSTREDAALAIVDRLNAEKKPWSFDIVSHHVLDDEVVALGRLVVEGVTKMAFGAAPVTRGPGGKPVSIGVGLKVAANDALARAARLFDVGLVFEQRRPASAARTEAVSDPENRVTQKQLGMIHGLARRKNIGRGEIGSLLFERFRKTEVVSLTKREASELIGELGGVNGHATP